MKRKFKAGLTSVMLPVFILDTTSTTGGGLSGVTHASSGLALEYRRAGQSSWTSVTPVTKTLGTYVSGGIVADGSLSGAYEVDFPDAAFAAGVRFVVCRIRGVANMLPVLIEIELDAVDYQADAFGALKPTVAGRTLDVSSGGEAGIDFANIGSPTTTVNLSGTTVKAVTDAVTVGTISANAMNASALATDAVTEIATAVEVQLGLSGSDLDATLNTMQGLLVGIDAVTDKLDTAMVLDGSVYQFTTNALENAPSSGGGGPTAAAIADAVWDEAVSGHLTSGSTGAALNAAGGSGDPWSSSLPGAYVAGQAGKMLSDINAKAALITSGSVQFTSIVDTQGKITTPIHIGDDYLASNGRAFEWTIDARSGFVVGTSTCKFGGYNAKTESEWLVTGTVSDLGGGEWKLSFDLDKDVTSTLEPGVYQWSVEIANAGGDEITEVYSGQNVTVKRKQT
jgi:hypothetical protein